MNQTLYKKQQEPKHAKTLMESSTRRCVAVTTPAFPTKTGVFSQVARRLERLFYSVVTADDSAGRPLPAEGEAMNKSLKDGEERGGRSCVSIATAKRHGKHTMFEDFAAVYK